MNQENKVYSTPESFHAQLQAIKPVIEAKASEQAPEPVMQEVPQVEHNEPENESQLQEEQIEASENNEEPQEETNTSSEAPKKPNSHLVPRSRLKEESEKRAALETQLMKEREESIRYRTQFEMMQQMQTAQNSQPLPVELDLDHVDPLDHETHQIYVKEIKKLRDQVQNIASQTTKQTEDMYFYNTATAQENSFKATNTDYESALKHLADIETFDATLEHGNNADARKIAAHKLERIVKNTLKNGGNAPETLYNMAVKKGYQPNKAAVNSASVKKGPNLTAINENMKKSASIGNLGTGVGMSPSPNVVDANKLRKDPNNPRSPFDPNKFHKYMQNMK